MTDSVSDGGVDGVLSHIASWHENCHDGKDPDLGVHVALSFYERFAKFDK